jgi:hypothetical protein
MRSEPLLENEVLNFEALLLNKVHTLPVCLLQLMMQCTC